MDSITNIFNDNLILFLKYNKFAIVFLIILIFTYTRTKRFLVRFSEKLLKTTFEKKPTLAGFINSIIKILPDLMIIYLIFNILGITLMQASIIIASVSAFVGFAFQGVLENFFGGMIILSFQPFLVGDVIEYSGNFGEVKKIELYYTTITTFNNEVVLIPNGLLIANRVKNLNVYDQRRLDLRVGVSYDANIEHVKETINKIVHKRKDLFDFSMPNKIGLGNIGASSLEFEIKMFVTPGNYLLARFYILESVKTEFDKENIGLPYDIIDLQINKSYNKLDISEVK
ncbi:mechanosensitive ion channel family protein [Oceanivirga miroungae]|uniref:Mechanosensitive ion channel protein MscS n=1 Tax=Oceanivirga miroungae TaxID=1130046 RepID=A0A6I8M7I5_9FUSO|nr:mechanosensitive ion channel family protein [Oceanivirga miroungae]VWL85417.1 mechanosensitive ion channel protein MscS [Oceanivirga miroungae]